ncbi:MAG: hypothetical protein H6722_26015 [Sandaracinus sp.]|nr:hypothetical protein [Sandaracinus sp.]MCB9624397.1 hypothetical protein [Sandaracinus sp.]
MKRWTTPGTALVVVVLAPLLGGADGCSNAFSESPAPDMSGTWDVSYDDRLDVTVTIGGATYTETLGAQGGALTIDHEGRPFTFDLDCTRADVVCPSEVWPSEVGFRQDDERYPHRIWLQIPRQTCAGRLVTPDAATCGEGTTNPECERVCEGEVTTDTAEAFGTIDEPGAAWRVGLGASFATNGVNCALLGVSVAEGTLETRGSAATPETWDAYATNGDVITSYAGGCLWAGDPDMDGELEALVLGAQVRFATGFDANKR